MMKAFSLFLLLFALASTQGFSQTTPAPASGQNQEVKDQKSTPTDLEANLTPQERAERDMLVPRKYQEQLAAEASKPIKYGPTYSSRKKTYSRNSSARKKYYGKRRSSSRRRR